MADRETDIESGHDLLRLNHQLSVTQDGINMALDRQVEGVFMGTVLPASHMKRYVHRVGELPAHLLEEISSARMDDRHLHLNELMD